MKRLLCIILCIVLLIPIGIPFKTAVEKKIRLGEIEKFCEAVISLSRKYDSSPKYAQLKFDAEGKEIAGAAHNRLIVAGENAQSKSAIDKFSGAGYTVFQYASKSDMLGDYEYFVSCGKKVQKDNILYAAESSDTSYWSYESCGASYAKRIFSSSSDAEGDGTIISSDKKITVGVMDSGIDSDHELFVGRLEACNVNFSSSGDLNSSEDDNGHGTAVAGVVAQSTPDNVTIKPYKVIDSEGVCSSLQVLAACEYILAESDKPDIVNISFTGYALEDAIIEREAVDRLIDAGIAVCVCAGNDFVPVEYATLAGGDRVITVSSHGEDGSFSSFSCYGDAVDVCAPGENIYSAKNGGGWAQNNGTSFSAPFASAACAYILMQSENITPAEIKQRLTESAVYMGKDEEYYYGAGLLNMENLLENKRYDTVGVNFFGGTYYDKLSLEFIGIPSGISLYYTLDKSIPTNENGYAYSQPIELESDTTITYALIENGKYLSDIKAQSYEIKHNVAESDFEIAPSGKITAYTGEYKNIIIPDKIGGITPTALAPSLFAGSDITSVELPESITSLPKSCFENCKALKHIIAPGVLEFTGAYVFSGCGELRSEVMPNLKTASDNAFYGCSKLHKIDFAASLEKISTQLFANSGILSVDFSSDLLNGESSYKAFMETPISFCDISACDNIQSYMFSGCKFLTDLKCESVKSIGSYAFKDCNMLKNIDLPVLESMSQNALDSSYFELFYAPKCTTIDGGKSPFSKYSYITTLDLPKLADSLCTKWLAFSTVENLYLDSVPSLSASCFTNTPKLKTVYLPSSEDFYAPYVNTAAVQITIYGQTVFKEKPPLSTVWIPNAKTIYGTVNLERAELFFAPSSNRILLTVADAEKTPVIVASPEIPRINFSVINSSDYDYTVISTSACPLAKYGCDFIACDDIAFDGLLDGDLVYKHGSLSIEIPFDFVYDSWSVQYVNKSRADVLYQFVHDLTGDNTLNAKDYAQITKYLPDA